MRNLIILSLLIISSCSVYYNLKPNKTFIFKGQVLARVQKAYRVNITSPLKAELTLMKKDSTIITKFKTNKNGYFNESIGINKKWNPLILKIRGLENMRIDTISKRDVIGYGLACTITRPLYQNIKIISDTSIIFEFECVSSETADPGGDEY